MSKQSNHIVQQAQLASDPPTPPSGYSVIYPRADGWWYVKNSAGLVTVVAGGVTVEQRAASFTLAQADNGKIIEVTAVATVTLPDGLSVGFRCDIVRLGTDVVTLTAQTTLRNGTANKIKTQYRGCTVYHVGAGVWQAIGTEA